MSPVQVRRYPQPPLCPREILRYAGCKDATEDVLALLRSCWQEAEGKLKYAVCWRELPLTETGDGCDFGEFRVASRGLVRQMRDCSRAVIFTATIGVEMDRLIARYGRLSPARALMLQAIGAERIEALCDGFCGELSQSEGGITPRFSPGYGDLPLTVQKEIFALLDCPRQIGVTLNDSLLMSPSKSVTAFVGLCKKEKSITVRSCEVCDKTDCEFRGVI